MPYAAGRRIALVDGRSNRWTFVFDDEDRQVRQVDPSNRTTTASFDSADQQTLRIDARGFRTTFVYGNGGMQTGRRYPDGTRVTFAFDGVGNRTKMHDATGRYTATFDELDRERTVKNPANKTISYSLDAAGQRRVLVEPEAGRFTYLWDDVGRCRALVNPQNERTSWTFDGTGRTTLEKLANLTRASYAYDDGDRLLRLANLKSDGTTISSFRDAWDGADNRASRVEADGIRVTWSYDNAYQLTRERRSGANSYDITYTYDAAGNRRVKLEDSVRTTYTWDANGNQRTEKVPTGGVTTNTWDYENRMTLVVLPTAVRNTFTYNGDGLRVQKQDSTGTLKAIWDGQKILQETNSSDVIQVVYSLSPRLYGDLVSQRRAGATKSYLFDPLGSTDRLADSSQTVTDSYIYQAFGKIVVASGSTVNALRFVGSHGYYYDADLAQYYVRARMYRTFRESRLQFLRDFERGRDARGPCLHRAFSW